MIIFILAAAAGMLNALMDTIHFHWGRSWLFEWLRQHWRAAYWWFYSEWSPQDGPLHWFFGDAWHTAKLLVLVCILAAIYFSEGIWDVLYFWLGWSISFNLFFHVIFVIKFKKDEMNDNLPW